MDIQISLLAALQAREEAKRGNIENEAWVLLWPQHTLLHTCASHAHTYTHRDIKCSRDFRWIGSLILYHWRVIGFRLMTPVHANSLYQI